MPESTTPPVNSGQGALPAGRDVMQRRVLSEPAYNGVQNTPRDSHRITPEGRVPR